MKGSKSRQKSIGRESMAKKNPGIAFPCFIPLACDAASTTTFAASDDTRCSCTQDRPITRWVRSGIMPTPCPHGRRRTQCRECGGGSICEHGRRRSHCKECGGSNLCEHGRRRSTCKACGGASICEHGKHRKVCRECGGASICQHGRQRHLCKECGGASICEHSRRRSQCKVCIGGLHLTSTLLTTLESEGPVRKAAVDEVPPPPESSGSGSTSSSSSDLDFEAEEIHEFSPAVQALMGIVKAVGPGVGKRKR